LAQGRVGAVARHLRDSIIATMGITSRQRGVIIMVIVNRKLGFMGSNPLMDVTVNSITTAATPTLVGTTVASQGPFTLAPELLMLLKDVSFLSVVEGFILRSRDDLGGIDVLATSINVSLIWLAPTIRAIVRMGATTAATATTTATTASACSREGRDVEGVSVGIGGQSKSRGLHPRCSLLQYVPRSK
jgi:hypothetical protein